MFDPVDGSTTIASYTFVDKEIDTNTVVMVTSKTTTEIKVYSYTTTTQMSTITSGVMATNTFAWSSTQVLAQGVFDITTYYAQNIIYVTQKDGTYSGTWTATLVLSTTKTKAVTDIFTIVPSVTFTDLPYTFTTTSKDTFISYILEGSAIPPRTPAPSQMLHQIQPFHQVTHGLQPKLTHPHLHIPMSLNTVQALLLYYQEKVQLFIQQHMSNHPHSLIPRLAMRMSTLTQRQMFQHFPSQHISTMVKT